MSYWITLEVLTEQALGAEQQDRLREAVLEALDESDQLPYGADVVTSSIVGEEA